MEVPDSITCVDCGQDARRLTPPPEEGWEPGDIVAYRCTGCNDRWDLTVSDPDGPPDARDSFDFRQWLADRDQGGSDA